MADKIFWRDTSHFQWWKEQHLSKEIYLRTFRRLKMGTKPSFSVDENRTGTQFFNSRSNSTINSDSKDRLIKTCRVQANKSSKHKFPPSSVNPPLSHSRKSTSLFTFFMRRFATWKPGREGIFGFTRLEPGTLSCTPPPPSPHAHSTENGLAWREIRAPMYCTM